MPTAPNTVPYYRRARAHLATGSLPPLPASLVRYRAALTGGLVALALAWGV